MSNELHVLSVKQPYAELIMRGAKRLECRTWMPAHLGVVAIHASSGFAPWWRESRAIVKALGSLGIMEDDVRDLVRSAIIGTVDIAGVVLPDSTEHDRLPIGQRKLCSFDGYTAGTFLWRLERPRRCSPVECDGKLNLWPLPPRLLRALPPVGATRPKARGKRTVYWKA